MLTVKGEHADPERRAFPQVKIEDLSLKGAGQGPVRGASLQAVLESLTAQALVAFHLTPERHSMHAQSRFGLPRAQGAGQKFLDGFDAKANVLGAKGVGELGHCGANAAVANAVFNATGVRVRDFPITIEKVLPGLPHLP